MPIGSSIIGKVSGNKLSHITIETDKNVKKEVNIQLYEKALGINGKTTFVNKLTPKTNKAAVNFNFTKEKNEIFKTKK